MQFVLILGLMAMLALTAQADEASLSQHYLAVYVKINEAEKAEQHGDYKGALTTFQDCYGQLIAIRKSDPDWQSALVLHRLADIKAKIIELWPKANAQPAAVANVPPAATTNVAPAVPSNLPPEVKAFQQALPRLQAEAGRAPESSPEAQGFFSSFEPWPHSLHNIYAWKANITAGEFWIGENGDKASAWAADWVRENGGADSPDDRNGYAAGEHASRVNPFYVALPFDDLKHPDLAQKWLPKGWARAPKNGKAVSACKDRWVELKNARGDDCFAQWEDAGPGADAQPEYVFGDKGPKIPEMPGIDVSPAVAAYLGLADAGPKIVAWRFVDDADVRPGAWMKMDEQAVIYLAMHRE
jgi:hypothetical protein